MTVALICGVSGQDGAYLSSFLLKKGYKIIGSSRDAELSSFSNLRHLNIFNDVELISLSPTDFRSVISAIKKHKPNEIYNLSGQSSVGLSFQQPVETIESIAIACLNFLEAIRFVEQPIKFYNACSTECFGHTLAPVTETSPFRPKSPYAVAKSTAFWEVSNYREAYNLFACSGILSNHESPLRPTRFVTQKIISTAWRIAKGSNEKLELGNIDIVRDWGWAEEYVEAMWLMLQQSQANDYIIASGKSYSLKQFVEHSFSALQLNWSDYVIIRNDLSRPSENLVVKLSPSKAEKELGWKAKLSMPDVVELMLKHKELEL